MGELRTVERLDAIHARGRDGSPFLAGPSQVLPTCGGFFALGGRGGPWREPPTRLFGNADSISKWTGHEPHLGGILDAPEGRRYDAGELDPGRVFYLPRLVTSFTMSAAVDRFFVCRRWESGVAPRPDSPAAISGSIAVGFASVGPPKFLARKYLWTRQ